MKPLEAGTVIQGRYEIKELIGRGGMGQVYLAVDKRLGHSVALKRTTVGDDPALTDAFENEARTLAQLRHPYLPKVSDHFVETDEQFLVMEYIAGDDLAQRLKTLAKPFPLNWVLFWADELLEALNYLHTHKPPIIHRDIKPQNLKITSDNHIVLLDFGLSKHSIGQTRITTSGSVVGYTPHYAPMEQIRGTGTNALSDIYALSSTLYHLLTNRVPPDALSRADTLIGGNPDPIQPLTEFNGEISEVISDAILTGMELSQEKRFGSARDMQKTLRKAYSELQKSMSAETVAFNLHDSGLGGDSGISGERTEVIPDLPVVEAEEVHESAAPPPADSPAFDKTEVIDAAEMQEIAGAAVSELADEADSSFGDKTEIVTDTPSGIEDIEANTKDLPPDLPESPYKTAEDIGDQAYASGDPYSTSEDFTPGEFKTGEGLDSGSDVPDATVAGLSFDEMPGSDLETELPPRTADESGYAEFAAEEPGELGFTEEYSAVGDTEEEEESAAASASLASEHSRPPSGREPAAPAGGASTGKYVAILVGLGALLFLLFGSALAVGWYYYSGSLGGGDPTPAPTAVETPFVEETPFETPVLPSPDESPEMTPEESPSVEESPGSTVPGTTSGTPRRTPVRTPGRTPVRTPPRTPAPTPKPTVRNTPRTLPTILQ